MSILEIKKSIKKSQQSIASLRERFRESKFKYFQDEFHSMYVKDDFSSEEKYVLDLIKQEEKNLSTLYGEKVLRLISRELSSFSIK